MSSRGAISRFTSVKTIWGMTRRELFWWSLLGAYVIFVAEQVAEKGIDQITHPLPFPAWVSNMIFSFVVVFALTGCALYARNLYLYHDRFTFQERYFRRGAILAMFGGAMGYLTRVFTQDAVVTYATPVIVLGYFFMIYAIAGTPVRQESEDKTIQRLKEAQGELDHYHGQDAQRREADNGGPR